MGQVMVMYVKDESSFLIFKKVGQLKFFSHTFSWLKRAYVFGLACMCVCIVLLPVFLGDLSLPTHIPIFDLHALKSRLIDFIALHFQHFQCKPK